MSGTTSKTKAAALAHVLALIAGTTKHFPNGSFTIGSTTYTAASLIQVLQGLADAMLARKGGGASLSLGQALTRLRGGDYFVAVPAMGSLEGIVAGCAGGEVGVTGGTGATGGAAVGA
jgi:hypothetical protein